MSQKGIEQLIGKALVDPGFFESFLRDPEGEIKRSGLDISPDELAEIKKSDPAKVRNFAESFSDEFSRRQQPGM